MTQNKDIYYVIETFAVDPVSTDKEYYSFKSLFNGTNGPKRIMETDAIKDGEAHANLLKMLFNAAGGSFILNQNGYDPSERADCTEDNS